MSVRAIVHIWRAAPATPLAKLVLVYFADNGDGVGGIDYDACASFCCCSPADVERAMIELLGCDLIEPDAVGFRLVGYVPDAERTFGRSAYVKKQLSQGLRRRVFERDGHTCKMCGVKASLTVDHVHPEAKGGSHDIDNLQTLCKPCNSRKKDRLP